MDKCFNTHLTKCFFCGEVSGVAIDKIAKKCNNSPSSMIVDYEPCDKCIEQFKASNKIFGDKVKDKAFIDKQTAEQIGLYQTQGEEKMPSRTSIEAYRELHKSGKINDQELLILKHLSLIKTEITSRELSTITGLERSSVTGRLNGLVGMGYIFDGKTVLCHITGRTVKVYSLNLSKIGV